MPEDAKEAIGHGIRAKRSKSGAISFDLLEVEATMHRSSETIGAIAAALAKAQPELTNPEKSLTATIHRHSRARRPDLSLCAPFQRARHRPQEPGPARDRDRPDHRDRRGRGLIRLTTMLAHSSGEWMSRTGRSVRSAKPQHRIGWERR